ncbi:IS481 family transposase [Streptosporangium subroseum]|nr:IS481 family transposase [Streptosporangium subroseum]WSA22713.1 IS481 family transposase [Streptosporangium subroseum]WSA22731.1 IS481 family transposase [Streptosporangium subroseum]
MELSVMEQRYRAVLEVEAGCPVTEVAQRYGVSRQSVHAWVRRYRTGGLAGLADRSHRPQECPHQTTGAVEALVCELRRSHPRWGPQRLAYELTQRDVAPVPSLATVYRILVRNTLIVPGQRRRPRSSYVRWERETPMELWQLDIMGGVMLADGRELKMITGIDDHSRFIVIAQLVVRASGRAVCAAFANAMRTFGVPEEVLTDNGRQFTGRFTKPRATEVLFERICRENGVQARNTQVRAPTTTGKVERWHKTVREEFLAAHEPFASVRAAQDALDAWVADYNTVRPHQALDMAPPISRFALRVRGGEAAAQELALRLPADLTALPGLCAPTGEASGVLVAEAVPVAVEVERVVPPSGNLTACGRQVWLGTARAGQTVIVWASATTMCVFLGEDLLKTHPVTLTSADLGRLMAGGGRAGRPAPAVALPVGPLAADAVVEVDRMVNNAGCVGLAGKLLSVGVPLAGQRVTLRIDAQTVRVIADGVLVRTRPSPLTPSQRGRLHGVRLAQSPNAVSGRFPQVQRVVAGNGNLMVAGCKLQVGQVHRGKVVTIVLEDTRFRVLFEGEELSVHPRTLIKEVNRLRASGHIDYRI